MINTSGLRTNLHPFECAWWALGASNPQNTPQNAYFWVISGQIFPDFGNLKPKVPAGIAVE